jgi:Uma2 family endonuclease
LHNGDRLTQAEFHRRYQACPEGVKAELIGGIVYMPSPTRWPHGSYHLLLGGVFFLYAGSTPGVKGFDNATTILGDFSEPQPDLALRILREYGGRSWENPDKYIEGAPELLAEIAHSSRAIDLHDKKDDYRRAGVQEYLVLCVEEQELHWFHFPTGRTLKPDRQGVARSRIFPGLWLDVPALLAEDSARLIAAVQQGLASRAHATFVKRLAARSKRQQD